MKGLLASFALATLVAWGLVLALSWSILPAESDLALPELAEGGMDPVDIFCVVPNPGSLVPAVDCTRVFTRIQPAVDGAVGGEEIRIASLKGIGSSLKYAGARRYF